MAANSYNVAICLTFLIYHLAQRSTFAKNNVRASNIGLIIAFLRLIASLCELGYSFVITYGTDEEFNWVLARRTLIAWTYWLQTASGIL